MIELEFTPLEFETQKQKYLYQRYLRLEFTPLEFETRLAKSKAIDDGLEFTPLEFETLYFLFALLLQLIRIYSVGV